MSKKTSPLDLAEIPSSQRRMIVVQTDDVMDALRSSQPTDSSSLAGSLAKFGAFAAPAALGGPIVWAAAGAAGAAYFAGKEAYDAWVKAREAGLGVFQISETEAKQLTFPAGAPSLGVMYVVHPLMPSVYYTTASFHRMVFEHKYAEALELLMSLGASHIEVEHVHGWSRELSAKVSGQEPKSSVQASASASSETSHSASLLFKADFVNEKEPRLPENLVWFSGEAAWQSVANGRLKYGMRDFSLSVKYQDDFGINAGLEVKAVKAGLKIGGTFENQTGTTWNIKGKFSEPRT